MNAKIKKGYEKFLEYFMYFLGASVVGWIYEVLVIMFENHHGFQNRGVLFGPYLPVYGVGMIVLVLTVNPIREKRFESIYSKSKFGEFILKIFLVFVATVIVTTIVELAASYVMSPTSWTYVKDGSGKSLWYYSKKEGYGINFQGRIALKSSLRFGFGGTALIYLVKPAIEKFSKKGKLFVGISSLLLVGILVDAFVTFVL